MEKVIVDCSTGQTTIVPLTPEEIAQREADAAAYAARLHEEETAAQEAAVAKQAVLDRLGLTADEAKLLLA